MSMVLSQTLLFCFVEAVVTVMEEMESFARTVTFLRRGDSFGVRFLFVKIVNYISDGIKRIQAFL